MNKNPTWKFLLIVGLVAAAVWLVYPPKDKLQGGLDLVGGTSLVYEIDTTGLDPDERKNLAQNMIPNLRKRVDPKGVADIYMWPQGDTRIEIQLPLSSIETGDRRKEYAQAREQIEAQNIKMTDVKQALSFDPNTRREVFATFAAGSQDSQAILDNLADIYDRREQRLRQSETLAREKTQLMEKIGAQGVSTAYIESIAPQWATLLGKSRTEAISTFVDANIRPIDPNESKPTEDNAKFEEQKKRAKQFIAQYTTTHSNWAQAVNELAEPETGLSAQWDAAVGELLQINLSITQLEDIMEMPPKSTIRYAKIKELKQKFPKRAEMIDTLIDAHTKYAAVGGRLDDPEDLKRMLKGAGVLEFRIIPTENDGKTGADELRGYREALLTKGPKAASTAKYIWIEIEEPETFPRNFQDIGPPAVESFGQKSYVLASNLKNEKMLQGGEKKWKLKKAYSTNDRMGRRAIGFTHDAVGGKIFYNLTKSNPGRPLAILLDNRIISAPVIDPERPIGTHGTITGGEDGFRQTEVDDMVNKLNAGSFPARLSEFPIAEKTIGPIIGLDNRNKGVTAGLIGLATVAGFMLVYYLLAGLIANAALFMNILFVLAMMVILNAKFTLPGIAGLILTIGMSVDANVLIFERIREEQIRGSTLRTAIANGYQRAFRTIFDANITTFITALILYMVASEEIKGFAIVLMCGIASSMFSALFATRVAFDFLVSKRIIKDRLVMLRLVKNPNINWMGLRWGFFILSFLLITGGMFVFFTRDEQTNSKYDNEFIGGTSVQINLKEGTNYTRSDIENMIRAKGEEFNNPALAAAKVYSIGKTKLQYEISTTETNSTAADVTFTQAGKETVETVTAAIEEAEQQSSGTLYNLSVTTEDSRIFTVTTSQLNKALMKDILDKAFTGKAEKVSTPVVNEVVNRAVREAFADKLRRQENLNVEITQVEKITLSAVELPDFLGGVKITCKLGKNATAKELKERFESIRFKRDMMDLAWYPYSILTPELAEMQPEENVKTFVYVSSHPEAAFRDLAENEWSEFIENEKTKITGAASLQTSLARVTQVDPSIGAKAKQSALVAIVLSLIAIVAYIWMRFGTARYGFAAIIALVHDVCITLGAVTACTYIAGTPLGNALGIQDFKINLQLIAAFLTIIGYSLNDTIVVFDRIRENRGKLATLNPNIISNSINQTLSRTLLTSFTTFMVVLIMYIWGGTGLRGFTFAMLIGIIVGTYSSIAIAAPILLLGRKNKKARPPIKKR